MLAIYTPLLVDHRVYSCLLQKIKFANFYTIEELLQPISTLKYLYSKNINSWPKRTRVSWLVCAHGESAVRLCSSGSWYLLFSGAGCINFTQAAPPKSRTLQWLGENNILGQQASSHAAQRTASTGNKGGVGGRVLFSAPYFHTINTVVTSVQLSLPLNHEHLERKSQVLLILVSLSLATEICTKDVVSEQPQGVNSLPLWKSCIWPTCTN